jgi:hypothetical protein
MSDGLGCGGKKLNRRKMRRGNATRTINNNTRARDRGGSGRQSAEPNLADWRLSSQLEGPALGVSVQSIRRKEAPTAPHRNATLCLGRVREDGASGRGQRELEDAHLGIYLGG